MTSEEFITFQKFNTMELAVEFAALLEENNIEYSIEDTSADFDPTFANNQSIKEFRLKLRKENFGKADDLFQRISQVQLDDVEPDYYLLTFSDDELMEIVVKRDEWSPFDFLLAQNLLKERGKEINPEVVELLKKQRLQELAKPEESQKTWIVAGYIFAFLGGLLGLFIGWHISTHKKTLPNGDRVYSYLPADRKHGNRIIILGIIFFIFWFAVRLLFEMGKYS